MNEDRRTKDFIEKFESAKTLLKAGSVEDIISLKFREHVVNSSDYQDLIDEIRHSSYLVVEPATTGELQGRGWTLKDKSCSVLLVEHETGIEILTLAGTVCSLLGIGLLPIIKFLWNRRGRHSRRPFYGEGEVEVRTITKDGKLIEQNAPSLEEFILVAQSNEIIQLRQKIEHMEKDIRRLKSKKSRQASGSNPEMELREAKEHNMGKEIECLCCKEKLPVERPRICPICLHTFKGKGWDGIDAHWRAKHEDKMSYEEFWETLCEKHKG